MKTQHRRAQPNQRLTRIDVVTQRPVKLVANEMGVIDITTEAERRVADAFGLRITRLPRMTAEEIVETASTTKERA